MTEFTELLTQEKEAFLRAVTAAPEAERVHGLIDRTWDRLLIKYMEQQEDLEVRADASAIVGCLRAGSLLVDTDGETKVWTRADRQSGAKKRGPGAGIWILLIALAAFAAAALIPFFYNREIFAGTVPKVVASFAAAAVVLSFFGGLFLRRRPRAEKAETRVEIRKDGAKLWRAMQDAAIAADRSIALRKEERALRAAGQEKEAGAPLSKEEIDLFSTLLEAKYSGDGEFALDALSDLNHFLHSRKIELLDYTGEKEDRFERLPGETNATLRPAMMYNGTLLKKGLATKEQ